MLAEGDKRALWAVGSLQYRTPWVAPPMIENQNLMCPPAHCKTSRCYIWPQIKVVTRQGGGGNAVTGIGKKCGKMQKMRQKMR